MKLSLKIAALVKNHFKDKTKKSDQKEILKLFEVKMKKNEEMTSEEGVIRDQQYDVVEDEKKKNEKAPILPVPVLDHVPMEDTNIAVPQKLHMDERTHERKRLLSTLSQEKAAKKLKQSQPLSVSEQNGEIEHQDDPDDDVVFICVKRGDFREDPVPAYLAKHGDAFLKYRLQREWDTEELIANMRAVGEILMFSKKLLDLTMNILTENCLDGMLMYDDVNLCEFFKHVPMVTGPRTAIIKIMQAMGKKMDF